MNYKTEILNLKRIDFYDLDKISKYIAKFKNLKDLTIDIYKHSYSCYEDDDDINNLKHNPKLILPNNLESFSFTYRGDPCSSYSISRQNINNFIQFPLTLKYLKLVNTEWPSFDQLSKLSQLNRLELDGYGAGCYYSWDENYNSLDAINYTKTRIRNWWPMLTTLVLRNVNHKDFGISDFPTIFKKCNLKTFIIEVSSDDSCYAPSSDEEEDERKSYHNDVLNFKCRQLTGLKSVAHKITHLNLMKYKIHYPSVPTIVKNCTNLIQLSICIKTKKDCNPFKSLLNHPSIERLDIIESKNTHPLTKTHIDYLSNVIKTMPKLNTIHIEQKYIESLIVPETIQVEKTDWFCRFECNYHKNE